MVCKKIMKSRTAHYVFSLKSEDLYVERDKRSRLFLGKLRAVGATDYVLYDNGICAAPEDPDSLLEALDESDGENERGGSSRYKSPRDTAVAKKMERDAKGAGGGAKGTSDEVSLYRRELAVIHFNTKSRPCPGVRGMEVCIPVEKEKTDSGADNKSPLSASERGGGGGSVSSPNSNNGDQVFNLMKPFERIRLAGKQNVMFSKTCLVYHEKQSR
jgi:hypothetical protein